MTSHQAVAEGHHRWTGWRGLVLPAIILALWFCAAGGRWVNRNVLPSPAEVARTGWELVSSTRLWLAVGASLARTLSGFVAATVIGVSVGLLFGTSQRANLLGGPLFNAYRQVAVFAWIPLISAWFGGGEATKVAFIVIAASTPVVLNTTEGVRSVPREQIELARVYALGRWRLLTSVILPSALPQILTGLHLCLVMSWLATVGAEFFLQIAPGVASILIEGRSLAQMDLVIVGVIVVGLIGFGLASGLTAIERRALRWRPSRRAEGT